MSKTETPDIVTMLQTAINDRGKGSVWGYAGLLDDAAAEIERLREAAKGSLIIVQHAERLRKEVEAEAARLRSELARTERNRDMWKGQCERQAEKLTRATVMARFYACRSHWQFNGRCDPNSSRFDGPNIALEYLRDAGLSPPSQPGENDGR
jgi:hypothetical protein